MDHVGDIAVGYSGSSSSVYPYVAYASRTIGDALGTLSAETIVKQGGGSQYCPSRLFCASLSRWGDYSAMSVDPVDDCTFWYTNEYEKTSGAFNWSTWITSFKFPTCSATQAPTITSANGTTFTTGALGSFTVTTTGSPTPSISETGALPGGVTFVDNGNGTATLSGTPAAGSATSYPLTITAANGVSPDASQSFTLTVNTATQALVVTTTSLPSDPRNVPYPSTTLQAANGTTPYSWSLVSGALPPGLTLSPSGVISGTPTKIATFSFTVQVADASGHTATATLSIKITQH